MRNLSISAAWEETKRVFARDGKLLASVALALIALPAAVSGLLNPSGTYGVATPYWIDAMGLIVYLVALTGQLSLIRLTLGPSITVGGAITHGMRRVPVYVAGLFMVVLSLLLVLVLIGVALGALGVPLDPQMKTAMKPAAIAAALVFLSVFCFLFVRFVASAPIASAEPVGPIAMLKRSWQLTDGNGWRLFAFLLVFFVGSGIIVLAVATTLGVVIQLLFGNPQPMSAAALILALVQALLSASVSTLFAVMLGRIYLQLAGTSEQSGTWH